MGFLKTLWSKFLGLKAWQKVLVIVLIGSMAPSGLPGFTVDVEDSFHG
jgi:hypothetical protein